VNFGVSRCAVGLFQGILMHLPDGRFEVRCGECEQAGQPLPIGIGVPIASHLEAKLIVRNHEEKVA